MQEFLQVLIDNILDMFEEFFNALIVPTQQVIRDTFLTSLVFLLASILIPKTGYAYFVSWQESLTCSILLGIVTIVDMGTRNSIKTGLNSIITVSKEKVIDAKKKATQVVKKRRIKNGSNGSE